MDAELGIMLPFKNEELYLHECLSSISRQDFSNFKVYMVDDHSTDKSPDIAHDFASLDKRFSYVKNKGTGVVEALLTAIRLIDQPLISRMDADDLMPENKLSVLRKALIEQGKGHVVTGRVQYFGSKKISDGYLGYQNWLNHLCVNNNFWDAIYRECVIPSCSWMMHSEDFISALPKQILLPEDYHLVFSWYYAKLKVVGINDLVHHWRDHAERTSKLSPDYQIEAFFRLKWKLLKEKELQPTDKIILWGRGEKAKILGTIIAEDKMDVVHLSHPSTAFTQLEKLRASPLKILCVVGSEKGINESKMAFEQLGLRNNQDFFFL